MPSPSDLRCLQLLGVILLLAHGPPAVEAQARGAYLPLDDPAHAVADLLVARGVLVGPDPALRPFLLGELRSAGAAALSGPLPERDRRRVEWLLARVGAAPGPERYELTVAPEVGLLAATSALPELLLAEGDSALTPAFRLRVGAEFGPAAIQVEPHRVQDGQTYFGVAVARVAWSWGSLEWGKVSRNWGPAGVTGLLVSPLFPPRSELGFSLGTRALRFEYRTAPVGDGVSVDTGDPVGRWWAQHRLAWRPSPALALAVFETVLAPEPGGADRARLSPFTPFSFPHQQGIGGGRNVTVGLDLSWRPGPALGVETQLVLDDFVLRNRDDADNPYPHRFGFVAQLRGAFGGGEAWRAYVASLSGLALSARDPNESFVDGGRGLGRLRPDHVEVGAFVSRALDGAGDGALATAMGALELGVQWRRQGARRFTDPFPDLPREPTTPRFPTYSAEIERQVWALVLGLDWLAGPVGVQADGQLQRRRYPSSGRGPDWELEGSMEVMWRIGPWGRSGER